MKKLASFPLSKILLMDRTFRSIYSWLQEPVTGSPLCMQDTFEIKIILRHLKRLIVHPLVCHGT